MNIMVCPLVAQMQNANFLQNEFNGSLYFNHIQNQRVYPSQTGA
jgi:hypothetical protein